MKRKRFSHHVDIFCEMFCGWRLTNSYDRLTELGSGEYEIDILSDSCTKDGEPIPSLSIAGELSHWFKRDAADEQIDLSTVQIARLHARLVIDRLEDRRRTNVIFPGREEADYVQCRIECHAVLESGSDRYEARKQDYEEWPYPISKPA